MYLAYHDSESLTEETQKRGVKKLKTYRTNVARIIEEHDNTCPEYSLVYPADQSLHDKIDELKKQFKGVTDVVLIGIGGQNLGVQAIHSALGEEGVTLHQLDTLAAYQLERLLRDLSKMKNLKKLAVIVSSKSGATTETLANAGVLLDALISQHGKDVYARTLFIGTEGSEFFQAGKRLGVTLVSMPKIVGGRYSISTEAGLVPLALLGHDTDALIAGLLDATSEEFESVVAENAARVQHYVSKGVRHYNFFAFEPRLATLGAWYRQLTAESLGKAEDRAGKPVTKGFLPTISTPVELHSVGQLYLSGFSGVYTDFVTFDDDAVDFKVPKRGIAKTFGGHTIEELATAIYGGVVAAYQEKQLPYRSTILDEDLTYSLGLFMGTRMLETMYIAELMNLNAFNQPNVELYKDKTRAILNV